MISIPVSALLEPNCFATELKAYGSARVIYHFRYEALDIWGAPARILKQLLEVALVSGKRQTDLAWLPRFSWCDVTVAGARAQISSPCTAASDLLAGNLGKASDSICLVLSNPVAHESE